MSIIRKPTPQQQRALFKVLGRGLRQNVTLAHLTSFKIGGLAALYYAAHTPEALKLAVQTSRALGINYFILGCGANILIGDQGFSGLVIANRSQTVTIQDNILIADSGATVYPDAIKISGQSGLSGLEHFAGIPSSIGGALWQNLHFLSPAPKRERTVFIAEILYKAELLDAHNQHKVVSADYFKFGYDYSILHDQEDIVLRASFRLTPKNPQEIAQVAAENLDWRAQRHPPLSSEPSAGSIFRKIEGIGAGRLIDQCGLKGFSIGGAQVSTRHANIIINRGGATAKDVRNLIEHIQNTVHKEMGYWLTPEISFVGDF